MISDEPEKTDSASQVPPSRRRALRWFLLAAVPVALLGLGIVYAERRPESSPVSRGAVLATSSGCYACHGHSDSEQRANLRQDAGGVWKPKSIPTFWENGIDEASVLKDWISNGVPAEEAERHRQLFIQMPAYGEFLAIDEIESISAWILAEAIRMIQSGAAPAPAETPGPAGGAMTRDQLFAAGDRLSRKHGCYQCHGELGQGGVSNPASFKGYVPGFFGADFAALTSNGDRDEIIHWIDTGRGRAIEAGFLGRFAKRFLDRQAVQMPGYRAHLTPEEKNILADFLVLLNKEGPLSPEQLEKTLKFLNDESSDNS